MDSTLALPSSSDSLLVHRPFGEVARRVFGLRQQDVNSCLEEQQRAGGRLGDIMVRRGLLDRGQVAQILGWQADVVAEALGSGPVPLVLPQPVFLSLCLPAYNEEENIEDTLDAACAILPRFVERFEIVVVNDGSRDRTGELVHRYARRDDRVRVIDHGKNRGYGAAVTSGLRSAAGDLIAFIDSDGQFSLLDLPRMLGLLETCDVVIGYRRHRADPLHRRFNGWGWTRLVQLVLGVTVRDLDCAFKVFRREAVDGLGALVEGQAFNADLLHQCLLNGLTMRELPVRHFSRCHGVPTGDNPKVILRALRDLTRLWWRAHAPRAHFRATRARRGAVPAPRRTLPPPDPIAASGA